MYMQAFKDMTEEDVVKEGGDKGMSVQQWKNDNDFGSYDDSYVVCVAEFSFVPLGKA